MSKTTGVYISALLAVAVLASCTKATQSTTTTEVSAAPSATSSGDSTLASPAPSASESPGSTESASPSSSESPASAQQFTDLSGVVGAKAISDLGTLGVFEGISGSSFGPGKAVTRREFVRWTFNANNAIANDQSKQIHAAQTSETAYFKDVPSSDADFAKIQGMQDAGISVGFPDKTFKPNDPITREQALAIVDGIDCNYSGTWSKTPNEAYPYLPDNWKDKDKVSAAFAPILASCDMSNHVTSTVAGRTWGRITLLRPSASLVRSDVALMLSVVGNRSAEQALESPSASPSP